MRCYGLRIAVALVLLTCVVPTRAFAKPIFLGIRSAGSARIVWDGDNDVVTSNDSGSIGLYSELGASAPSDLLVQVTTLVGNIPLPVDRVAILLSLATAGETCVAFSECHSIQDLGLDVGESWRVLPSGQPNVIFTNKIIPFFAPLIGPSGPFDSSHPFDARNGDSFVLSASDQIKLLNVLATFGADDLRVGLSVDVDPSEVGLISADFTLTAVPEPASWLLLGSGLTLVALRRRFHHGS